MLLDSLTHWLVCRDCRLKHPVAARSRQHLRDAKSDWCEKHKGHRVGLRRALPAWLGYTGNADQKEAFQAEQSMTVTSLHSLASSATAGWSSASVDNSANLYLDVLVSLHIAAVNTAPANNQAIYTYAYGSTDGAIFTSTGTSGGTVGTEGALTFPSISTLPVLMKLVNVTPYPVQNKALDDHFSVARAFGGILPPYWGVCIVNFSGMTLAASGNTVKYRGVYATII